MRSVVRGAVSMLVGLAVAPVLPLYPRRVMTRSSGESGGDGISWAWERVSLRHFVDGLRYMSPEERPRLHLWLNLGLCALYAALVATALFLVWRGLARRRAKVAPS
ncbi:MAG TPA: hypothetical protein VK698_00350 [Kofleriaceae bacterium]|nr:hypothetical protein [Kofleriaceae bacterium]